MLISELQVIRESSKRERYRKRLNKLICTLENRSDRYKGMKPTMAMAAEVGQHPHQLRAPHPVNDAIDRFIRVAQWSWKFPSGGIDVRGAKVMVEDEK